MIEDSEVDVDSVPATARKMFSCNDILKITQLFHEADADGGGGLDIEEFESLLNMMYPFVDKDGIKALHMKIDTNCDGSVDISELLTYLLEKDEALENMKNEVFPKRVEVTSLNCCKTIKGVAFIPEKCDRKPDTHSENSKDQIRSYMKGNYITVSSNGILNLWTENFDRLRQIELRKGKDKLPFSHAQKMSIDGIAYITDLGQLAVSTDKEIRFYDCNDFHYLFQMNHTLLVEENRASVMNYWSNGTKAIFSFGDVKGCLYVFVSNNVKKYQLFNKDSFERDSNNEYRTAYVSSLLRNTSANYMCFKVPLFSGICSHIRYFPDIDTLAVCGDSSRKLVLFALPKSAHTRVTPCVFDSPRRKAFFSCVEYCPLEKTLVTGGIDGALRLWNPQEPRFSKIELEGHAKPIIDIVLNHRDKILISISEDKNVRVWSKNGWLCQQSFVVEELGHYPISSLCYNAYNNELILANLDIGKLFGRGTDAFAELMRSHEKSLCCALYHQIFKQVVSVCQDGVVTVWNALSGQAVMRFRVLPDKCMGHTLMTFDEPQRRLITVTEDRKVKLWNFNNGAQLAVLPFDLPNGMRCMVCKKNRLFVAGRNRKIFDLDIEGESNRSMQHDYLTDVSSMDVLSHKLFTISSVGNTVVWDIRTRLAIFWLNGSIGPTVQVFGKGNHGISHKIDTPSLPDESCQKNIRFNRTKAPSKEESGKTESVVNSGPIIACLKTRVEKFDTATLLIAADGYIYAWTSSEQGSLLAKFRAVNTEGVVLVAMSTDLHEQKLLTEDSTGMVYLWDIRDFATNKKSLKEPFESVDGCSVSLCPPPLLGHWQSHSTAGGASVMFDSAGNVITAGLDCNVRLWTNSGRHVGIFGKDEWKMDSSTGMIADQEQAGRLVTSETSSPEQFSQSQIPFPNVREQTSPPPYEPDLTDNELFGQHVSVHPDVVKKGSEQTSNSVIKPHPPRTPPIRGRTDRKGGSLQTATPCLNETKPKFGRRLRYRPRDVSKDSELSPCPPDTVPVVQRSKQKQKSVRLPPISPTRHSNTAESVRSPYILETGQLINSLIKPHSPQTPPIRGRNDIRGHSLQAATPHVTEMKPPFRPVLKYHPQDASVERDLRSLRLPPLTQHTTHSNTQNTSQHIQKSLGGWSEHTAEPVRLPPILTTGQLTNSQFKPHPPQTPPIRDRTDLRGISLQTATPRLNETNLQYGRVPATDRTGEMQQDSKHADTPPASDLVELVHRQTKLKPHVPQIRRTRDLPRFSRVKEFI